MKDCAVEDNPAPTGRARAPAVRCRRPSRRSPYAWGTWSSPVLCLVSVPSRGLVGPGDAPLQHQAERVVPMQLPLSHGDQLLLCGHRPSYIGQSIEVGGTPTDMVAYATNGVFVQAWIGAEDHLPRRLRALYRDDPAQVRHDMELSNWQLDPVLPPNTFTSSRAQAAKRISFIPRQAGQAKGTHLRAIRASVRDIFRLWVKWILLKRGISRRRGTVRRLVREEWPLDAIS